MKKANVWYLLVAAILIVAGFVAASISKIAGMAIIALGIVAVAITVYGLLREKFSQEMGDKETSEPVRFWIIIASIALAVIVAAIIFMAMGLVLIIVVTAFAILLLASVMAIIFLLSDDREKGFPWLVLVLGAMLIAVLATIGFLLYQSSKPTEDPQHTHLCTEEIVKEATCCEAGIKKLICTCGDINYAELPATGHTWDKGLVTNGVVTYTCTVCGETKTEIISDETHVHEYTEQVTTEATCCKKGTKTFICSCGTSYTEAIPATGNHTWDVGKVTKAATETTTGIKTYTCTVCGQTKTEAIPEIVATHKHSYTAKVTKAAICGVTGIKTFTCSCGASYTETIPATGKHVWDTGKITKAATESATGIKTYTCVVCGQTKTEVIPKLATHTHDYVATVNKAATPYETGEAMYTCSCGASYTNTIPATGVDVWAVGFRTDEIEAKYGDKITIKTTGYAFNLRLVNADIASLNVIDSTTATITLTSPNAGGSIVVYDSISRNDQVEIIIIPS